VAFQLPLAGADVHLAAFQQLGWRDGQQLLEGGERFIALALLKQLYGGLVVLKGQSRARRGVAA
jgi:hypothetical protein